MRKYGIHIGMSCLLSHSPQWGKNLGKVANDFLPFDEIVHIFKISDYVKDRACT